MGPFGRTPAQSAPVQRSRSETRSSSLYARWRRPARRTRARLGPVPIALLMQRRRRARCRPDRCPRLPRHRGHCRQSASIYRGRFRGPAQARCRADLPRGSRRGRAAEATRMAPACDLRRWFSPTALCRDPADDADNRFALGNARDGRYPSMSAGLPARHHAGFDEGIATEHERVHDPLTSDSTRASPSAHRRATPNRWRRAISAEVSVRNISSRRAAGASARGAPRSNRADAIDHRHSLPVRKSRTSMGPRPQPRSVPKFCECPLTGAMVEHADQTVVSG